MAAFFGFEAHQVAFNGVCNGGAGKTGGVFGLDGQIDCVEELDEKRLPIDCRPDAPFEDTEAYCNNFWTNAFSASII